MSKPTMNPYDSAFAKLYFVNLLSKTGKYRTFFEAQKTEIRLCAIAQKLSPRDLEFLTDRIENIQ